MTTHSDGNGQGPANGSNGNAARVTRPPVERTSPDRTWIFTQAPAAAPEENRAPSDERSADGTRDAAYRTLNQAYGLVDEYIRQGQRMAEAVWLPLAGLEAGDATSAPERFMRAMSDMTMAWVEVMQQWTSQAPRQKAATGTAGPFGAGKTAPAAHAGEGPGSPQASRVLAISVQASGRVEASVELNGPADPAGLVPTELRTYSGNGDPITEVAIVVRAGQSPAVRISVPDGQPSGTYSGLLLESETKRPRGTISVTIE